MEVTGNSGSLAGTLAADAAGEGYLQARGHAWSMHLVPGEGKWTIHSRQSRGTQCAVHGLNAGHRFILK